MEYKLRVSRTVQVPGHRRLLLLSDRVRGVSGSLVSFCSIRPERLEHRVDRVAVEGRLELREQLWRYGRQVGGAAHRQQHALRAGRRPARSAAGQIKYAPVLLFEYIKQVIVNISLYRNEYI